MYWFKFSIPVAMGVIEAGGPQMPHLLSCKAVVCWLFNGGGVSWSVEYRAYEGHSFLHATEPSRFGVQVLQARHTYVRARRVRAYEMERHV